LTDPKTIRPDSGRAIFILLPAFVLGFATMVTQMAVFREFALLFSSNELIYAVLLSFWLVFTGGVLGMILMRFAASVFIRMLHRFPGFETSAYLLVLVIGIKVILEGLALPGIHFHSARSPSFWIFW